MTTKFTSIFDHFTMMISDYRLTNLFQVSENDFNTYLQGWLMPSIVEFENVPCNQSLAYDLDLEEFTEDLSLQNQILLAKLMKKQWLSKEVNDITQMRIRIQDKDFKTFSEAQNLKEKRDLLIQTEEEISRDLTNYGYRNNNWVSWFDQDFYGS